MAIHLTPTELARESGMERREVIEKCMELGVPIFQGRIDKTLFLANVSEQSPAHRESALPEGTRRKRMESSTVPAVEESTGSATIADMMARAAERFGDRPAA